MCEENDPFQPFSSLQIHWRYVDDTFILAAAPSKWTAVTSSDVATSTTFRPSLLPTQIQLSYLRRPIQSSIQQLLWQKHYQSPDYRGCPGSGRIDAVQCEKLGWKRLRHAESDGSEGLTEGLTDPQGTSVSCVEQHAEVIMQTLDFMGFIFQCIIPFHAEHRLLFRTETVKASAWTFYGIAVYVRSISLEAERRACVCVQFVYCFMF